ncbi:MAG TPA: heavy metal translocating P-type ATPase [Actinomycetota bacterium]|jgi:heavy metal translocating P-type ATPase|nr:heavy metal translocating P-type ATPase [Actinomycetota bacterium]
MATELLRRVHRPRGGGPARRGWASGLLLAASVLGLAVGGVLHLAGQPDAASLAWALTTAVGIVPLLASVVAGFRRREPGVDLIALLAMVGAVLLEEFLAGAVIALMLASGRALEARASGRASRELQALLERAPRSAHRYQDGELVVVPVGEVATGDRLLVMQGEVIPVDGRLEAAHAVLDESALTGESLPVERERGDPVRSGAVNAGPAVDLRATAAAADSTYAGIVRLVEQAQSHKAPFVRLANRYALAFVPLTLLIAGAAWLLARDPVRGLAVLVVATPCPLILAAPIAIVSGMSRAARRGIIVKDGGALETLATGRVLLLDKTGTLTAGSPRLREVKTFGQVEPAELLRLAASLDQASPHPLAAAITTAARQRGLALSLPTGVEERHGAGIRGLVDGHALALGNAEWAAGPELPAAARALRHRGTLDGASCVFAAVDGQPAGALVLEDPLRPEAARVLRALRRAGIRRIVMVSGDHAEVAESLGVAVGVDQVLSERDPADKVDAVEAARGEGVAVMVGDGVNDAPALAAADVGVAMGARGATASSESADVVLTVDRLDRLAEAMRIARRSRAIAEQSVLVGMGLSLVAMLVAAGGWLIPVVGAVVQEAIDVAVILNALRALGEQRQHARRAPRPLADRVGRLRNEHDELAPLLDRVREVADRLEPGAGQVHDLRDVAEFLERQLLPHERRDDELVAGGLADLLGGEDPLAAMRSTHLEIAHLARRYRRLLDGLPSTGPTAEDVVDLRRTLYGLDAILRLHNAQEEELYGWIGESQPDPTAA